MVRFPLLVLVLVPGGARVPGGRQPPPFREDLAVAGLALLGLGGFEGVAERHDFWQGSQTNLPNDLRCVTSSERRQAPFPSRAGKGASLGHLDQCSVLAPPSSLESFAAAGFSWMTHALQRGASLESCSAVK
eukprot:CAMPEP_0180153128 /NCGR_PEP_ID=MMETSP0986-20121125/23296_1 /TAXON_ID=697907 /ORGANISM="non described non described, Strain CCMP2293" /LENGTH=131 /DNA_ID=CAMNT_0022101067 /DNA_START=136 /DNA_END=532 /DNA_ORIENTATION=+